MITLKIFDSNNRTEYFACIRKFHDGTFYVSTINGLLVKKDFKTPEEAIIYAYSIMPNVFAD